MRQWNEPCLSGIIYRAHIQEHRCYWLHTRAVGPLIIAPVGRESVGFLGNANKTSHYACYNEKQSNGNSPSGHTLRSAASARCASRSLSMAAAASTAWSASLCSFSWSALSASCAWLTSSLASSAACSSSSRSDALAEMSLCLDSRVLCSCTAVLRLKVVSVHVQVLTPTRYYHMMCLQQPSGKNTGVREQKFPTARRMMTIYT